MNKLMLAVGVVFFLFQSGYASQDRDGSMRPAVWRSTEVCHALNFVQLSTRAVNIHQVRVASATVNNGVVSGYFIFNSTARPQSDNAANFVTTGTRVMSNLTVYGAANSFRTAFEPDVIDVFYSSGVVINKLGVACVELLWDFSLPTYDPIYPWRP